MHSEHRKKLIEALTEETGIVWIKGASPMNRYNTDYEFAFRQESNFLYLTNCHEPDFEVIIDLDDQQYYLIAPKRDANYAVWMGFVPEKEELLERYKPDTLLYSDERDAFLKKRNPEKVFCLDAEQAKEISDLGFSTDDNLLADALAHCRCIKTEWECNQLRSASAIAFVAHTKVRQMLKPGLFEYELKAAYLQEAMSRGLLHEPYNGIFAGGKGSAVLHYVDNNRKLKDGDLFLIDAGTEYNGYAADITRTYPVNGRFTDLQADLYEVCLRALNNSIAKAGPGVEMETLHLEAARDIVTGMKGIGLLKGNIDEMMEKNIFALFFPHGLGHFLGLDTHDVGGIPKNCEPVDRPGLKFLRARRKLEPGMVITIEPGVYFIPALLKPAFEDPEKNPYLNVEKLSTMMDFGGYRIEDNLIITEDGVENLTRVPKRLREISN